MVRIIVLVVLNIPIFLFVAWLAFDSKEGAAQTFGETIVAVLQIIFIPRIVRVLLDMDDEGRSACCRLLDSWSPAGRLCLESTGC